MIRTFSVRRSEFVAAAFFDATASAIMLACIGSENGGADNVIRISVRIVQGAVRENSDFEQFLTLRSPSCSGSCHSLFILNEFQIDRSRVLRSSSNCFQATRNSGFRDLSHDTARRSIHSRSASVDSFLGSLMPLDLRIDVNGLLPVAVWCDTGGVAAGLPDQYDGPRLAAMAFDSQKKNLRVDVGQLVSPPRL